MMDDVGSRIREIQKTLKKDLDEDRYQHTIGVMYTAAALTMSHKDVDMDHALLAGLLHDCAKCITDEKKLKLCQKYGIELSFYEKEHPFILHAKLGAKIASLKFNIEHPEILTSIQFHTTGKAAMTPLEKVIYIADYIEPGRNKAPNLRYIREIAFSNLDECMYLILKDCLEYLKSARQEIDPMSMSAFEYYWNVHNQM